MKIYFIFAHPDDEAYGPAGTISKLAKNHEVKVISLCRGDRPGNEEVSAQRIKAFGDSCKILGAESELYHHSDCRMEYNDTLKTIELIINNNNPDAVYTHNISDIHKDHRLVAEACLVACRPKPDSSVKEFYMCEMPSSTDWSFGQLDPPFIPNKYVDVTSQITVKHQVMSLYSTEHYNYPDCRSEESMESLAMYRGKQVGIHRAEAFKLVFRLC